MKAETKKSKLFLHLSKVVSHERMCQIVDVVLNINFPLYLGNCQSCLAIVQRDDASNAKSECDFIPSAWNIDRKRLEKKIEELLSEEWVTWVKTGFVETLNTALK